MANESTVKGWKRRKDFNQMLAKKKLEILARPIKAMAERFPKDFIERHPDTRETFAPPTQKQEVSGTIDLLGDVTFDNLMKIAARGKKEIESK